MSKVIVLLSSGLDSTVNFYQALQSDEVVLALTFDYGQRAAKQEICHAKKIADKNNIPHKVVEVPWFKEFTKTSLVDVSTNVPIDMKIDDLSECEQTAKSVWVPNRNGIMANIAAGFAEGLGANQVVVGFNKEEAATFPDNSQAFMDVLDRSFAYSTLGKISMKCYTTHLNKTEIVRLGKKLSVPFDMIWSCYMAAENPCQQCESCLRLKRALREA